MKFTFKFNGRQAGAIGIFYDIKDTYTAENISEAKSLLYEDYEHIRLISIHSGSKQIDKADFDKAPFITVRPNSERQRAADRATYLYTRSDSKI